MHTVFADPVFQAYSLAAAAIIVLLYGLGFYTAKVRADRKIVVNAEDAGINGGAAVADNDHADVLRIKRAHLNLIESAVPFLTIGFLYAHTDPSLNLARGLYAGFVGIRLLHALFYANAKQPFRTASFGVGAVINLFMVVQVVRAALAG